MVIERIPSKNTPKLFNIKFTYYHGNKKDEHLLRGIAEYKYLRHRYPLHVIEDYIDHLEQIGPAEWLDTITNEVVGIDEVLDRYGYDLPFDLPEEYKMPDWLENFLKLLSTRFIQTQRLFAVPYSIKYERRRKRPKPTATVEKYSIDMAEKIQESLRQSAVVAASLDRTFPRRLLKEEELKQASDQRIRDDYEKQDKYRRRLMNAGLLQPEAAIPLPKEKLKINEIKVLWHYLKDVEKKFIVFDDLLKKVELFTDIINTRFLYKTFTVDKDSGFIFTSSNNENVPLRALSSGEQHELVLAYELLFLVEEKSLILIDEPELSLHVTWQHKFLEDIGRISNIADLDFIVATHSPQIIHNRSDLMVPLGENNK